MGLDVTGAARGEGEGPLAARAAGSASKWLGRGVADMAQMAMRAATMPADTGCNVAKCGKLQNFFGRGGGVTTGAGAVFVRSGRGPSPSKRWGRIMAPSNPD